MALQQWKNSGLSSNFQTRKSQRNLHTYEFGWFLFQKTKKHEHESNQIDSNRLILEMFPMNIFAGRTESIRLEAKVDHKSKKKKLVKFRTLTYSLSIDLFPWHFIDWFCSMHKPDRFGWKRANRKYNFVTL